jgi:hypothetical protein
MNITIIGFGNIAHALVAYLGKKDDINVSILSSNSLASINEVSLLDNASIKGNIQTISNNPSDVIPDSDLILFCVPSHVREALLVKIAPYVLDNAIIGSFPGIGGFYESVSKIINKDITIFASQRVPYIARVVQKGKLVDASIKDEIKIAVNKQQLHIKQLLENLLDMKVTILDSFMEVDLTNSNPILHSARLYSLINNYDYPFDEDILFYRQWDDNASKILLQMDEEFMQLVAKLKLNINSLKIHYGVKDYKEMTTKLQNIKAFKSIQTPLIKRNDKYYFDIKSRYFQEDISHDLAYIIKIADLYEVNIPKIKHIYKSLLKVMNDASLC